MRAVYWAAGIFVLIYLALDLNRLYALRYGADLGTFTQMLVNLRHGSSWNFAEWRPHFQVHDSWALVALVPFVALLPRAETLLTIQVLAVASAAIPLVYFARELGVPPRAAVILGIAYLLSPAAQGLAYENFSENVFVPLVVFSGALAVRRRAFWPALACAQLLAGLKEDEILFLAWFGAACAFWWDRRLGTVIAALACMNGLAFWSYEHLAGVHPSDPGYSFTVFNLQGKLSMVALLLAPFAFAPLGAGRWLWLGLPLLAEIFFMKPWAYDASRIGSHWVAPLSAAAAIAAAFGLRRWPKLERAMIPCALVVMLLIFNDTVLRPGRWPYIVNWSAYGQAARIRDGGQSALLPRTQEGVWAVAAANPRVQLKLNLDPKAVGCPAYNTDARAFFAALAGHMPAKLCGGVAVQAR